MKYLLNFFYMACLLKLSTFMVKELVGYKEKEYSRFYNDETFRKYQEHGRYYSYLEDAAGQYHTIPDVLIPEHKNDTAKDRTEVIFHRTWYQAYANKINQVYSTVQLTAFTDRRGYPGKLVNTVREEKAKAAVDSFFEKYDWFDIPRPPYLTKGVITEIHEYHGHILLKLVPYSYPTADHPFEELTRGAQSMPVYSNPFYYTGNLKNWSCSITNPVSCEVQTIHFK